MWELRTGTGRLGTIASAVMPRTDNPGAFWTASWPLCNERASALAVSTRDFFSSAAALFYADASDIVRGSGLYDADLTTWIHGNAHVGSVRVARVLESGPPARQVSVRKRESVRGAGANIPHACLCLASLHRFERDVGILACCPWRRFPPESDQMQPVPTQCESRQRKHTGAYFLRPSCVKIPGVPAQCLKRRWFGSQKEAETSQMSERSAQQRSTLRMDDSPRCPKVRRQAGAVDADYST